MLRALAAGLLLPLLLAAGLPAAAMSPAGAWPAPLAGAAGEAVRFPSASPFTLADAATAPATEGLGTLFLPPEASAAAPVPAVVMLHGAGGVLASRELTYGRQLATVGIATLAVDAFAARRERARSFTDRLLEITEAMLLADAYAALRYLAALPEIDAERIALIGFSYGGMAATYAAHSQVAEALAPRGPRFAGHVAFYAPCIARFEDRRATGAPLLMLIGAEDRIVDRERCAAVADDLRAGGAEVETVVFEGAHHQWDGGSGSPWRARYGLADCRLVVQKDGSVYDEATWIPMRGPLTRKAILALCVDEEGYLIGRDDAVRERSNAILGLFLGRVLAPRPGSG